MRKGALCRAWTGERNGLLTSEFGPVPVGQAEEVGRIGGLGRGEYGRVGGNSGFFAWVGSLCGWDHIGVMSRELHHRPYDLQESSSGRREMTTTKVGL